MNVRHENLFLSCIIAFVGLLLIGCNDQTDIEPTAKKIADTLQNDQNNANARLHSSTHLSDWIEIDQLPFRSIVSEVSGVNGNGPIYVYGVNPRVPNRNAAMVFNSEYPSGDLVNRDLGTPNRRFGGNGWGDGGDPPYVSNNPQRKVLIVSKDFKTSNPYSQDVVGSRIIFDYSALGGVSLHNLYVLDIDEGQNAFARFYYKSAALILELPLPVTGDNGAFIVPLSTFEGQDRHFDVVDVHPMEVWLNGRAALDLLSFVPSYSGCTSNVAYWKNHSKYNKERDPTWGAIHSQGEDGRFFLAGATFYETMTTPSKEGNIYYTLAREFIAADLNYYRGAYANAAVKDAYMKSDPVFRRYTPAQIGALGTNDPLRKQLAKYANTFKKYNNGQIGPGRCTR